MVFNNKIGQLDNPVVGFAVVIFGLILFAPLMLKVFNSIQTPMSAALGNISNGGAVAQTNYNAVMTPLITMWDKVIIAAFIFSLLLLIISSFMIDTHPVWVILYIFINFLLMVFMPNIMQAADTIYESSDFVVESSQLSFMNMLRTHYGEFLVGIMVLTGILIYGKISLFPSSGGSGR